MANRIGKSCIELLALYGVRDRFHFVGDEPEAPAPLLSADVVVADGGGGAL